MSNTEPADDDQPLSLDDPDWVDRIVARAVESAEQNEAIAALPPTAHAPAPTRQAPTPAPTPDSSTPPAPAKAAPADRDRTPDRSSSDRMVGPPDAATSRPKPSGPTERSPEPQPDRTAQPQPDQTKQPSHQPAMAGVAAGTIAPEPKPSSVFDQEVDTPIPVVEDDTEEISKAARTRALIEWAAVIIGAIAVAFLVKTFLVQAFYIPSSSMVPTLQVDDRVLVNKLSYDFNDVGRGDLIVFGKPDNLTSDTDDLIKRVIGLPGETLELIDGRVFIDGRGLNEPYVGDLPSNWLGFDGVARELCGGDAVCLIPEDHVFVMGDNRTGSTDSRRFGPIHADSIVGRAFLRIWPLNDLGWL